jgi:hypothetical protein
VSTPPPLTPRRPDLDALRAFAMLVGIGLHAALSFTPFPWPVQDSRQNEWFGILFAAVHGFRMPLFFLLSGFFTTMLWRKRGLKALLGHRFQRILVPCMIGLVTIVPAVNWISGIAIESGLKKSEAAAATQSADSDIWSAVRHTDLDAIDRHLQQGADINAKDPAFGITPLSWAALHGETVILEALLERGATIDASNRDGGTPLHAAAFLGHADIVALLIRRGASLAAQNHRGDASLDAATVDWETTRFLIALLKIEIDEGQVNRGRIAVIQQLHDAGDVSPATTPSPPGRQDKKHGSRSLVQSLIYTPVFHHLWFLWFLCWLVPGFAVCAWIARFFEWRRPPHWLILTPARFLWLIPLTMIPQWFMGTVSPSFGPDTSAGLLPMPHVLLYYAIFFGFGALYFDCDDSTGRPGRKWILMLLLALLLIFPLGLGLVFGAFGLREKGIAPPSSAWPQPLFRSPTLG